MVRLRQTGSVRFRAWVTVTVLAVALPAGQIALFEPCALAQKKPEDKDEAKDKARDLFKRGAEAVDAKKYADGLQLLTEAESLFHAPTHVLYTARAQAGLGKLLEAKGTYEKLRDEKLGPKPPPAFVDAQKKGAAELEDLERRIPKVVITVEPSKPSDLAVTMSEKRLENEKLGTAFQIDPGSYTFEAKGGGMASGRVTVDAAERTTTEVKLVLTAAGKPGGGSSSSSTITMSSGGGGWSTMKIASIPFIAIGAAGLAAGGVFGALSLVRTSEADDAFDTCASPCPASTQAEIHALDEDAALFGNVAIGALAGGAALLTTGIILFALAPASSPADEKAAVDVRFTPGGVWVDGRF